MKVSLSSMLVATAIAAASGLAYSQTAQPVQNSQGQVRPCHNPQCRNLWQRRPGTTLSGRNPVAPPQAAEGETGPLVLLACLAIFIGATKSNGDPCHRKAPRVRAYERP